MSLLIKALEQAAKDREAATKNDVPAGAETLGSKVALADSASARRNSTSLSGLAQIEAQQRARAASVVQATERGNMQLIEYLRRSPVAMIGAVAVLAGVAFGIYVYLQLASPGVMARQAPPPTTPVQAPPPSTSAVVADASLPAPALSTSVAPAVPAPLPALATTIAALPELAPAGSTGTIANTPANSSVSAKTSAPGAVAPLSTVAVIGSAAAPARVAAAQREEREAAIDAPKEARAARARAAAPTPAPATRERIVVSAGTAKPTMNPLLGSAYASLQSGDSEQARALYKRISDAEPLNIDALLGLAFLAVQENRTDEAMRDYLRILQLDPRNSVAQAAMIALVGRADPVAAETRLKQLISREPSPFLHFILGNLYADQSAWPQAQQSYFQAQALETDNADYAYNLAVSLDHLRQSKLALNYYRRAEQLATARGRSNFNVSQARERIRSLSTQVE